MTTAALDLTCPACRAPAGTECDHDDRQRLADLRNLEKGSCNLCGALMVRGSVLGAPVDAWHPEPAAADACPVIPDPNGPGGWDAYAAAINSGLEPGHPGVQHFVPAVPTASVCPECRAEKHKNCTRTVPADTGPEVNPCACLVTDVEAHR